MTPATWLLLLLAGLTLLMCLAFLLPEREPIPHPYVTDPLDLAEGEHRGRHERPEDVRQGATQNLGSYARWAEKRDML